MFVRALFTLCLIGCTGTRTVEPVANVQPPEQIGDAPTTAAPTTAAPSSDITAPTPESLYGQCRARVEGVEAPGECTVDADCAKAGCSQEVCLPAAKAPDVMSTCEILPCFRALETCGCHDGVCSWTLKPALPGPGPLPLPRK